ncbi:multidrug ABC transporter ATPase [Microbacterium oleivorans]|uniref:multidrug ABC transporter ATPase n=1 Tax=Microbacterium oleivorans TaxID=273677 RepID=UPI00080EB80B|nr:multidrug ABC transporter ATPase [Microbacterium oleivorans]
MSTPPPAGDLPVRRIDRILAFMSLGLLVLSVICFFAIIIASGPGGLEQEDFASGVWPAVSLIVYVAPPVAFALLLALLIMTFARRGRANKGR